MTVANKCRATVDSCFVKAKLNTYIILIRLRI